MDYPNYDKMISRPASGGTVYYFFHDELSNFFVKLPSYRPFSPSELSSDAYRNRGTPTGNSIRLENNIEAYVAEPKKEVQGKKAILFLPDVIGIWENSKLMADQFAANGYYTLMPDTFNGDAIKLDRPADFDFMAWLTKGSDGKNPHTTEAVDPIVASAISYLHSKGYTRIASVGYCFGAKYVARFMSTSPPVSVSSGKAGEPLIQVGYVAHPSFVEEAELAAIKGPWAISAAETDAIFPAEMRHKSETILQKAGYPYQINLFSGVEHGFATRADLSNEWQKWSKEQAFIQAVEWIKFHL